MNKPIIQYYSYFTAACYSIIQVSQNLVLELREGGREGAGERNRDRSRGKGERIREKNRINSAAQQEGVTEIWILAFVLE